MSPRPCWQVRARQSRPLDALYPIVYLYLDALIVKIRDYGQMQNRAVYVALGVSRAGQKEILGLWSSANEGAKFWLQVLTELKNRGRQDPFIACVDGRKGFPQAIEAVYLQTTVQLCRAAAQDLRAVCQAATVEAAAQEREVLAARWDRKYPTIRALWKRHGEQITPLFAFPPESRKLIYTTKARDSLPRTSRKGMKTRGAFPNEESAGKLLYWALRDVSKQSGPWPRWQEALNRFALLGEARFPQKAL